jgi:hypothetical protein
VTRLNDKQFGHGDPRDIPLDFGTTPIPEGHVRANHYTSEGAIEGIKRQGLTMSHANESYAKGTTEYPSIFANAGPPSRDLLQSRPVAELHVDTKQLDIGGFRTPQDLESRRSTITTNQDVPASNIIAVHEPWHQHARYLQEDAGGRTGTNGKQYPSVRSEVAKGEHDNLYSEPDYAKALDSTKIVNAATVMLGGKL